MNDYFRSPEFKQNLVQKHYWFQQKHIPSHLTDGIYTRYATNCESCCKTGFLCDYCCRGTVNGHNRFGFFSKCNTKQGLQWKYHSTHTN